MNRRIAALIFVGAVMAGIAFGAEKPTQPISAAIGDLGALLIGVGLTFWWNQIHRRPEKGSRDALGVLGDHKKL